MRECRREAKELLVQFSAETKAAAAPVGTIEQQPVLPVSKRTEGQAIIGGGCCVQLSVEYMPSDPLASQTCEVGVAVVDSEGCKLTWMKEFKEGYHVKESIMTTYPGAQLRVMVVNAIARVRWCEVFSC